VAEDKTRATTDPAETLSEARCADFKGHLFWAKRPGGSSWEIFY
jgi:hypothetical protein